MSRSRQRAQSLVLFVISLLAIMAMVGLIIDGGNAYAQQRSTQNGSDAAAEAGATILVRNVMAAAAGGTVLTSAQLDAAVLAATKSLRGTPWPPDVRSGRDGQFGRLLYKHSGEPAHPTRSCHNINRLGRQSWCWVGPSLYHQLCGRTRGRRCRVRDENLQHIDLGCGRVHDV